MLSTTKLTSSIPLHLRKIMMTLKTELSRKRGTGAPTKRLILRTWSQSAAAGIFEEGDLLQKVGISSRWQILHPPCHIYCPWAFKLCVFWSLHTLHPPYRKSDLLSKQPPAFPLDDWQQLVEQVVQESVVECQTQGLDDLGNWSSPCAIQHKSETWSQEQFLLRFVMCRLPAPCTSISYVQVCMGCFLFCTLKYKQGIWKALCKLTFPFRRIYEIPRYIPGVRSR